MAKVEDVDAEYHQVFAATPAILFAPSAQFEDFTNRAGRDKRGRVDAHFRPVAQGQRLRPRDEIVRRLDQPLGIAADM